MVPWSPPTAPEKPTAGSEKVNDQETKSLWRKIPLSLSVTTVPVTVAVWLVIVAPPAGAYDPVSWKEMFQVKSVIGKALGLMSVEEMASRRIKRLLRASAACAIVSIVEPARYPLMAEDYPKMATWDTMTRREIIARQGHEERATIADA